jgi:hypothetical protein
MLTAYVIKTTQRNELQLIITVLDNALKNVKHLK